MNNKHNELVDGGGENERFSPFKEASPSLQPEPFFFKEDRGIPERRGERQKI